MKNINPNSGRFYTCREGHIHRKPEAAEHCFICKRKKDRKKKAKQRHGGAA